MTEIPQCKPNYSAAGRRRRIQIAIIAAFAAAAAFVALEASNAPWYVRLLLFFPGSVAAGTYLQVRRNTCVARARTGMFEHEDLTATPAPTADAAASRKVAATITRDAGLAGLALALLGAATAFL